MSKRDQQRAETARQEWRRRLARWRFDPIAFTQDVLRDSETNAPFQLYPAEIQFLRELLTSGPDGRLRYVEAIFGAIKKSGKTAIAA